MSSGSLPSSASTDRHQLVDAGDGDDDEVKMVMMMVMVPCHGPGAVHIYVAAERLSYATTMRALVVVYDDGDGDDEDEIINRSMNR